MTKRNPEFGGFSACFAVRTETDRKESHSAREDGDSNTTQKTNNSSSHSTIKSHHTPSNHRQPTLHTSKAVFTVQFFRCESPRKFMFASGSHQLFETSLPPAARSEYQRLFHFNPFTHPNMFNLCSVFISKVVKSKAVSLLINDICQYGF